MSSTVCIQFHPIEAELINILKRFLKGEHLRYLINFISSASMGDKSGYFITPLKNPNKSDQKHARTCGNGAWRGQTSAVPIKNRKGGSVVGYRRNYIYTSKGSKTSSSVTTNWLMREYFVGDDFFKANNIPKQDYALCRIKKHLRGKKDDDDDDAVNMEEDDALETIQGMLLEPDSTCCTTQEVTEETDQWESIINEVCDEKIDGVENTTALVHGEYDLRRCGEIRDVQEDGVDGIGSNGIWEAINGILNDVTVDIPDNLWLDVDHQPPLLLISSST
ncbi:NAC domain-containing protein 78-like [Capsicum annuum]|nr:NAC domain-containing protein 78-like [Capsicum annuum]